MRVLIHLLLLGILLTSAAAAQTATLRGQVSDETGAVIPGAKVTAAGPGGLMKTSTAGSDGTYILVGLAPGSYTVQASAPQMVMAQPSKITLNAGAQTLNLQLTVASLAEKVNVQENAGPAVSVDAASNANALVLRGEDLDALSDDPNDLMADLQALAGPSAGPNGGAIYIDGFSSGDLPAKASIREIRINQNPFSPEYDKLGYGRIEIFTKPGMDKYRATVNYNLGTQWWNSRNPYSAQKAPFLLQEFEGDGGGPLGKRASFTVDAQRNMVDNGSITNGFTLDPNLAITPFSSVITTPGRFTRITPRVDYQLSESNTLTLRYGWTHSTAQDAGVGGLDLISRGYHNEFTNQTLQVSDTVLLGMTVNETRLQYFRSASQMIANSTAPQLQVLGAFNGGGSQFGRTFDTQNNFELQNYTSTVRGTHSLKFGVRLRGQTDDSVAPQNFNGTFTFGGGPLTTSIERYRQTLLLMQQGLSPEQIRLMGAGATQFTIGSGIPGLSVNQVDVGIFGGDEWRVRPNLTLSYGFRYETQTNIHDWTDFAPRLAIAWAPGATGKNPRAKTVIRAGFGMFYDRFALANTLAAERYNGIVQQQYVIPNPDFFPNMPSPEILAGSRTAQATEVVSSNLRAPYIVQSAFTLEQKLPWNSTLAVTYTNSHGVHMFRSQDVNAPLPGTYNPNVRDSGVFPLGHPGAMNVMESSGLYNQNQLIANVNAKVNASVSIFGFYVLNFSRSNTDGINTFPANPYNFSGEYGPAATDVRHRVTVGGSINLRWNIRLSPFVVAQTGPPFDITAGNDLYGTTLFNGRPGIATGLSNTGLIQTPYGLLDPNPSPGEPLLPRNFGRGPGQILVNLRIAKTIGFGSERGGPKNDSGQGGGGGGQGGGGLVPAAVSGRGLGGLIGRPTTSHRYNLTLSMSIRNLLNHNNPGPIIGNITSPLFGQANQIWGAQNGEGFYETANNRRLELQIRFSF